MHVKRRSRRSARDERGAVAILVALSLVAVAMGCGMAVDLGNMAQLHRHAQYTVDNAAISGAYLLEQGTDTLPQIVSATETYLQENYNGLSSASSWKSCPSPPSGYSAPPGSDQNCVTFNGDDTSDASAISVMLPPQTVPFTVARLAGFLAGGVEASATAVTVPGVSPCALCLLGPSGQTLTDTGTGTFTVTDANQYDNAGITVNSNGTPASAIGGSGSIVAPNIGVVGTAVTKNSGTYQPTPVTGVPPVGDPLGSVPEPTPTDATIPTASFSCTSACGTLPANTYGNISLGGGGSVTLPPGNYSSISVTGSGNLTLESGIYFITGPFTVGGTGGATVTSNGAMLYFTCSSDGQVTPCTSGESGGSLSLTGTGNMTLGPMTSGIYTGLTVFYDRNNTASITMNGTPGLNFSGTVYAKSSTLNLEGNGGTIGSLIVVNSATISGNSPINVNYDATQNIRPPGVPYLCSTTANNC